VTLTDLLRRTEKLVIDNSPAIMTAIGVVGTVTTAYLTGRASFKAAHLISKEELWDKDPFTTKEKVKLVWKEYIPPACIGILTIASIIGANRVGNRRAAALAVAYSVTERAFDEYKDKIVEKFGKGKEQAARDEIAQDRITKSYDSREVLITGNGDYLCYEMHTGRYFQSTMETLLRAENTVNRQIIGDGSASLTDFYFEVGLPPTKYSDEIGWNLDHMVKLSFSATLTPENKPCMAIDFVATPIRHYYKNH
jgi:hypothetical protein